MSAQRGPTGHQRKTGHQRIGIMSPPHRRSRRGNNLSAGDDNRSYDPENVDKVLYDSLKIFNLGHGATLAKVKARYRSFARIFHPDKHALYRE